MRPSGFWTLDGANGKKSFTGTSATVLAAANLIEVNPSQRKFFTGRLQNLSTDTDIILQLKMQLNLPPFEPLDSTVNYTLHSREYIQFRNVPVSSIGIIVNGTVILAGVGMYLDLDSQSVSVLGGTLNILQYCDIEIGKIDASSVGSGTPQWQNSAAQSNPAANTTLSTVTPVGRGVIYGVYINSPEPNSFLLSWTSGGVATSKIFTIPSANGGTILITDLASPINAGDYSDAGVAVTINNVGVGAGSYQADIYLGDETA